MKSWALLTAALWITGAVCRTLPGTQNSLKCDPEKQYERNGRCCHKCPPGTFLKAKCTITANTTCLPCGPTEYMSVWNEDLSCTRFMVCDAGKALRTVYEGNNTYPRVCECIEGYHFDPKLEICMENGKCHPGFGVQLPVQSNKNTVCIPCPVGYYSNTSSATEACSQWTNCSDRGLLEIAAGTNIADAICDQHIVLPDLTKVIILTILPIVASGIVICIIYIVCYRKKFSTLIGISPFGQVQNWVHQSYDQVHESQKKPLNVKTEEKDCIHKVHSSEDCNPLKESVVYQCRMIPTEDEYMEQRLSPEPENGSMVAGTDSYSDFEIGSLGTLHGFSDTSSDRLLPPSQEEGVSIPLYSHQHCGQSAKEIQDSPVRDPEDMCSHCTSQHTFHVFSQAAHCTSRRNDGEEPSSCFTDRQYSRSGSSTSTSSTATDIPASPSGNVTGNHNTTVISTAPVMNIKTDLVVVYYNSSSPDTHTAAENEDTMRRPTQEESQSHYDSFVANTQPTRYTDIPCPSASDTDSKMFADQLSSPESLDTFSQEQPNIFFMPNTNFLPVQEEGKPEFYL